MAQINPPEKQMLQIRARTQTPAALQGPRPALPFLKWAGGKRWLAPRLAKVAKSSSRLVEPFVGSGAVFFALAPDEGLLSDINADLIATFKIVKQAPDALISCLSRLEINRATFGKMRSWRPASELDRAVRLIYLNRTAFNGLYRVNRDGEFNVPFGCKEGTRICDREAINAASAVLANARITREDFRAALDRVRPNDVVYADPPYTVKHDNNGFRRYNEKIFSWEDQRDLASLLTELVTKGTRVIVSNAHHETVRRMYPTAQFKAFAMTRTSCMAGDATRRGACNEWLLVSRNFGSALQSLG